MENLSLVKPIEEIRNELRELATQYKSGRMTYKVYKREYSKIKNYNSVSNQVKRFGAKVAKTPAGYEYIGKNFRCELFKDGCETDYWTTFYKGDNKELSDKFYWEGYNFETKSDLVYFLLEIDRQMELK